MRLEQVIAAFTMMGLATQAGAGPWTRSLTILQPPVPFQLDPHKMEDAYSMAIVAQLNRGLLRYTAAGDVVTDLAESWTESADKAIYTFELREARFSDGRPIRAEHVRASFARLFHVGSTMGADMEYIEGAAELRRSGKVAALGIDVLGPRTIRFRLRRASSLFLKHLAAADCAILPITRHAQPYAVSPAAPTSGAYRLAALSDDAADIVKWRVDDLDSARPPERVRFLRRAGDAFALAARGDTDTLDRYPLSRDETEKLRAAGWVPFVTEVVAERFVVLNPAKLAEPLRRRILAATDQDRLVRALGVKSLRAAYGLIPAGMPGQLRREDLAEIKRSLAAPETARGTVPLEYADDDALAARIAHALRDQWTAAGIEVELVKLPKREALARMFGSSSTGALVGAKGLDYFDGYSVLTYFRSGYAGNYFHVEDAAVDRRLDELVALFDSTQRAAHYRALQRDILRHATVVPLVFGSDASGLWSPRVSDVPAHPGGLHTLPIESVLMK